MLKIVTDDADRDDLTAGLDELVAEGARRMLMSALEAEVADYVDRHRHELDESGRRRVVRNGRAPGADVGDRGRGDEDPSAQGG